LTASGASDGIHVSVMASASIVVDDVVDQRNYNNDTTETKQKSAKRERKCKHD